MSDIDIKRTIIIFEHEDAVRGEVWQRGRLGQSLIACTKGTSIIDVIAKLNTRLVSIEQPSLSIGA